MTLPEDITKRIGIVFAVLIVFVGGLYALQIGVNLTLDF